MTSSIINKFISEFKDSRKLEVFTKLAEQFNKNKAIANTFYCSTLAGSSKSIFLSKIFPTNRQILVLLPTRQDVNELNVELTIIGLDDKIVAIDNIEIDTIQEKKMTKAGLELAEIAKQNGQWEKAYSSKDKLEMPKILLSALKKNTIALKNFNSFSPSNQQNYIGWGKNIQREQWRYSSIS